MLRIFIDCALGMCLGNGSRTGQREWLIVVQSQQPQPTTLGSSSLEWLSKNDQTFIPLPQSPSVACYSSIRPDYGVGLRQLLSSCWKEAVGRQ